MASASPRSHVSYPRLPGLADGSEYGSDLSDEEEGVVNALLSNLASPSLAAPDQPARDEDSTDTAHVAYTRPLAVSEICHRPQVDVEIHGHVDVPISWSSAVIST